MRRRIAWLVAATTSAVVLAFLIPLALLVRTIAQDRALATGNDEARAAAILVSNLGGADPRLASLIAQVDARSSARTSVLMPDGAILGSAAPGLADDPEVPRARGGTAFTSLRGSGGAVWVPVVTEQGTAVVRTLVPTDLLRAGVDRAWLSIGALGLLLLAGAVVIADRLGRRISVPVTDLAGVAESLQQGRLEARAAISGPPETRELGLTLNRLADRIQELLEAERAAVGDLSHRLRTPMTALRLDIEAVADAELAARLQRHLDQLQRSVTAVVRDARRPLHPGLRTGCDAARVVAERVDFWSVLAEDQGRRLRTTLPDHPLPVGLDEGDLRDVVDILVDNVFAHTDPQTSFEVRLEERAGQVHLEVTDDGPGLPGPDGTSSSPGPSSGLGLQIVRRTVAAVDGHLTVLDTGHGLAARVVLPVTVGEPAPTTRS